MAPTDTNAAVTDARDRRAALRGRLVDEGIDAMVVADRGNFTYLTGYLTPSWENRSRPMALAVRADGAVDAVLSGAEAPKLTAWDEEVTAIGYDSPSDSVRTWAGPTYASALVDVLVAELGRSAGVVAVERAGPSLPGLPAPFLAALTERLGASVVDADELIWPLRMRKTNFEIERIGAAADSLGKAFDRFAGTATPGMTERELHAEFAAAVAGTDADVLAYLVVVAGPDQPMLGPPTDRIWSDGELLAVDACLTRDGYWADFCRHYAATDPDPRQSRAYARLLDGLAAGGEALVVGARAADVAGAVTGALDAGSVGFGRFGHGIGLELAEPPSIQAADDCTIAAGMTLCVEPSANFAGVGQLVAEEIVAVTDAGVRRLSPAFPSELEVLTR